LDRFVPLVALKKAISVSGFGKIFHITLISGGGAKFYVKKYLQKAWPEGEGLAWSVRVGQRRVSGSRGFRISGGAKVSWEIFGLDFASSAIARFSFLVGINFQSRGWTLARSEVFDDWIRTDWRFDDSPFQDLVSVFGLEPVRFGTFSVDSAGSTS
jgi:hypothetical protein